MNKPLTSLLGKPWLMVIHLKLWELLWTAIQCKSLLWKGAEDRQHWSCWIVLKKALKDVKEDRWWQNTQGSWYQWWRQLNARRSTWEWGRHVPWWSYITTTKALLSSWLKCIFANPFTISKTTLYNNLLWMFWPDLLPFYFFKLSYWFNSLVRTNSHSVCYE